MKKYSFIFLTALIIFSNRLFSQKITNKDLSGIWINKENPKELWEFKNNDTLSRQNNKQVFVDKYVLDTNSSSSLTKMITEDLNLVDNNFRRYYNIRIKNSNEISLSLFRTFKYVTPNTNKWGDPKNLGWQEYKLMKIRVTHLKRKANKP